MNDFGRWLLTHEVAHAPALRPDDRARTVYRLVEEGRIPALRVSSRAVRIPEPALPPRQKQ